jgi:hypothetical protein
MGQRVPLLLAALLVLAIAPSYEVFAEQEDVVSRDTPATPADDAGAGVHTEPSPGAVATAAGSFEHQEHLVVATEVNAASAAASPSAVVDAADPATVLAAAVGSEVPAVFAPEEYLPTNPQAVAVAAADSVSSTEVISAEVFLAGSVAAQSVASAAELEALAAQAAADGPRRR